MLPATERIYRVGDVELDFARGSLRRAGRELPLREQSLQVLRYLVEHRGRRVTKEELIEEVWHGAAVTDDAVVQCIADIRRALGDDHRRPRFIKTIPRVGYRFLPGLEGDEGGQELATVATEEITSIEIELGGEHGGPRPRPTRGQAGLNGPRAAAAGGRRYAWVALPVFIAAAVAVFALGARRETAPESAAFTPLPLAPGQRALAVVHFENRTGTPDLDWLRVGLAEMLVAHLSREPGVTVLKTEQLQILLDEMRHKPGQPLTTDKALHVGRRSRAEAVILGAFAKSGEDVRIEARAYDVGEGRLLAQKQLIVELPGEMQRHVAYLARNLADDLGLTAGGGQSACAAPPANLVGWWPGDGDARDITRRHDATPRGGAAFAGGRVGRAFSFDGKDDFVEVTDASALNFDPASHVTVELWAYRTGAGPVMHLLGKRVGCSGDYSEFNYQVAFNNRTPDGLSFGGGTGGVNTNLDLPPSRWTHLAATFDGTTYRFYMDGLLVAKAPGDFGAANGAPFKIGTSGTCGQLFEGLIDEVSLYDRALSAAEIQSIYGAGGAGKCKGRAGDP